MPNHLLISSLKSIFRCVLFITQSLRCLTIKNKVDRLIIFSISRQNMLWKFPSQSKLLKQDIRAPDYTTFIKLVWSTLKQNFYTEYKAHFWYIIKMVRLGLVLTLKLEGIPPLADNFPIKEIVFKQLCQAVVYRPPCSL